MDRPNLTADTPIPFPAVAAEARKWAWAAAMQAMGGTTFVELNCGPAELESLAVRLADFVQTGTFSAR